MPRWTRSAIATVAFTTSITIGLTSASRTDAVACSGQVATNGESAAERLNATFSNGVAGVAGADYQRAFVLPDGRVLWTFQDAFVNRSNGRPTLVHNIGLVEDGSCWTLLRSGTRANPKPWIGAQSTTRFRHWYWPLAGTVGADGRFQLFVAEMRETGRGYLTKALPIGTWLATINLATMKVEKFTKPASSSTDLYGWSVVPDGQYTYVFAHCYRQFGSGFLGHDACTNAVKVGRVEGPDLSGPLTYWTGSEWSTDAALATNIAPSVGPNGEARTINPMQIALVDGHWIAVTKEGDWWGSTTYLDVAPSPTGPWTSAASIPANPFGTDFNTYFASIVSSDSHDIVVGLSNNRWDGAMSNNYHPTFSVIPLTRWVPQVATGAVARSRPATRPGAAF